jgi:hypothetical protein
MDLPKQSKPIRVRLPFELKGDVGLGDAIKRATTAVGIAPCHACQQRAVVLNRYVVFTGRHSH